MTLRNDHPLTSDSAEHGDLTSSSGPEITPFALALVFFFAADESFIRKSGSVIF